MEIKEIYETPEIEVIAVNNDIITESIGVDLPEVPMS